MTKSHQLCGPRRLTTFPRCRRQFAKYTCPTCNIPYCCLVCFRSPVHFPYLSLSPNSLRSQAHNRCSESFYKKEVESDIHAQPSKSANERTKTLELLRKFEENANDLSLDEVDSDDDDRSDVTQRFAGLNLGIFFLTCRFCTIDHASPIVARCSVVRCHLVHAYTRGTEKILPSYAESGMSIGTRTFGKRTIGKRH